MKDTSHHKSIRSAGLRRSLQRPFSIEGAEPSGPIPEVELESEGTPGPEAQSESLIEASGSGLPASGRLSPNHGWRLASR